MQTWTEYIIFAVGQVFNATRYRILFVEARVNPHGICSGLSGPGADFLVSTLVFSFLLYLHLRFMLVEYCYCGRLICTALDTHVICILYPED
jgi:hypothetical protein